MKWTKVEIDTITQAVDLIYVMLDDLGIEGIQIEDNVPLTEEEKKMMYIDFLPELPEDDGTAKVNFYVDVKGNNLDSDNESNKVEDMEEFIKCLSCKLNYSIERATKINEILENNFFISKKSKDPIKNTVDTVDTSKKNAAISSCNAMIRTISYNSMLYGVNSGSVLDLNINGIKPISGTWSIDSNGNIILSKVTCNFLR